MITAFLARTTVFISWPLARPNIGVPRSWGIGKLSSKLRAPFLDHTGTRYVDSRSTARPPLPRESQLGCYTVQPPRLQGYISFNKQTRHICKFYYGYERQTNTTYIFFIFVVVWEAALAADLINDFFGPQLPDVRPCHIGKVRFCRFV